MPARELSAEESANQCVRLARAGRYKDALRIFDTNICTTLGPGAMSYYALCLAMEEGRHDKGISICVMAAGSEARNPEIYLNLGKICLASGRKTTAIKAFRKGLWADRTNAELLYEMRKMGTRRRPVISWLNRRHALNRFLGRLANRIGHSSRNKPLLITHS